jgi:hypothetical protein
VDEPVDDQSIAAPLLMLLLIGGGIIYAFGYARAVMHRANSDYKKTKAAVPGLRKDFWSTWWRAVKTGFWIALGLVMVGMWAWHDAKGRP